MKLLLDENLSRRLLPALQVDYPGSSQVALLGLEQGGDHGIWEYARAHDYVLVAKDADFHNLQTAWGYPPKIILLALGNGSNKAVLNALTTSAAQLQESLADERIGLIEIV